STNMRIDSGRRCRERLVRVGPSTITKIIVPEDSCAVFWHRDPEVPPLNNTRFSAPDTFGIDGYYAPHSLNKNKRWTIPERLRGDRPASGPYHNLRVSASTHAFNRADRRGIIKMDGEKNNRPS
ncbi:hypothetical protein PENTCL1PPCAC_14486, partial [Pristionchus entomophagus]